MNKVNYHVRSRALVDIVRDIKDQRLVLAPYFQRRLVWRIAHKVDFIKTIFLGYPFAEVFISRGEIDINSMISIFYVVDGQQRLTTIRDYVNGKFQCEGKYFSDLAVRERDEFLKYEIAVIDIDLHYSDPAIVEIFKRLNRTYYSLSAIEKMASEFASSEFMQVAKLIVNELGSDPDDSEDPPIERDPNISQAFWRWTQNVKMKSMRALFIESHLFSKYEISRRNHLIFVLNILATMSGGFYNRNDIVKELLDSWADIMPEKDLLVERLESASSLFQELTVTAAEFWLTKSNTFSLLVALDSLRELVKIIGKQEAVAILSPHLRTFESAVPPEYSIAAKEGVNNRKERSLRNSILLEILRGPLDDAARELNVE